MAGSTPTEYMVGDGDVLQITVYDNADLDTVVRIDSGGSIQYPLIGQVKLSGLTVSQVIKELELLLADGYLIAPQVSVFIQEYRSKKIVIMGQINTPGIYELSGSTSLLELISMAGGLREDAGDKLTVNRKLSKDGLKQEVIQIDLKRLLEYGDLNQNVMMMDRDSIFISKAGMFYVTGEVEKPDAYKYDEGATVLKVISMAGGFTKIASKGKVRIIRTVDGKEQILEKVSMQEPIFPDDVIVVPQSFF
ncbi:MAG: SLBB domain-containing protein [Thermodesulfobacteriota bacterium]|nr:SLBB domain-containing protein [Thermodesulfobacteriota bacterium]